MNLPRKLATLALASLLLLPTTGAAKAPDEDVDIVEGGDLASWDYSPTTVSVPVGTAVIWRNTGTQAHTVTSQDQLFDSRLLDPNRTWSYTFETPGTYHYFCVPHPWMKGIVVVTAPEEPTRRPTASPTTAPSTPTPAPTSVPTPRPSSPTPDARTLPSE